MKIDIDGYVIRSFRQSDAEDLARHANNRQIWSALTDGFPHPYRLEDAHQWLQWAVGQEPESCFALASESELIGGIGLNLGHDVWRLCGQIGYWVAQPYWGQGIATNAVRALTSYGFETFGFERIEAEVFAWNHASARVLEKAGYGFESRQRNKIFKDGEVHDALLYVHLRTDALGR